MKKNYNLLILHAKKVLPLILFIIFMVSEAHCNTRFSAILTNSYLTQVINEKKVTIKVTNKTLDYILTAINKQTGIDYGFQDTKDMDTERLFSLNVSNINIKDALEKLLAGSEFTYIIKDGKIIIVSAINKTNRVQTAHGAQKKIITIKGKITDESGDPVIGATVLVEHREFNRGALSNDKGEYQLILPLVDSLFINYSYMGKKPVTIKYNGKDLLNVIMLDDVMAVANVVVTGYGNISQKSFTGNAKTVTADEIRKISPNNIMQSLEMIDPSFRMKVNNDMGSNPNAMPELSIRGASGIGISQTDRDNISESNLNSNPNLPTFIMDGFEVSARKLYDMDINRIQSITILKDAAATAIYGSRAANGVVVITTVAPKAGKLLVSYNYTLTLQMPDLSDYNLMNAQEKLEAERSAGLFDIAGGLTNYNKKKLMVEQGCNTDWISLPLRNTSSSKHYLRVEGGAEGIRYGFDVDYSGNNGVMKGSDRRNYGASVDLQYNINKLIFKNVVGYNGINQKESPYGYFSSFTSQNPYMAYLDEFGIVKKQFDIPGLGQSKPNPMYEATLGSYDERKTEEFYDNLSVQYFLTEKINFKANVAITRTTEKSEKYTDPQSTTFSNLPYKGQLVMGNASTTNVDGGVFGYYNNVIGKHYINLLVGMNIKESTTQNENYTLRDLPLGGFTNPQFAKDLSQSPTTFMQKSRLFGALASLNYTYDNIYLLDLTGRLDGNSAFGSESRFAPFWSAGLGLNIHNYGFMKDLNWLSELKIRGSYGITGMANFPTRTARTVYTINSDGSYATGIGATMQVLGNKNLKWEKTKITDVGFNANLWNGLVMINASYYNRQTVDLIADMNIPSSSGFLTYKDNVGEMSNKGFEADLRFKVIGKKNTTLYIAGSLASNKNRIEKISESLKEYNKKVEENYNKYPDLKPFLKYVEGASVNSIYAMPSLGIDPQTGQEMFIHPDGKIDNAWLASDNTVIGNTEPKVNGTFSANFYHKGFSVNVYFSYRLGGQQYNTTLQSKIENADLNFNADKRVFTDRWINPGDVSKFKSLKDYNKKTNPTSRFVQDENTLSMKSASLSYDIPRTLVHKIGFNTIKVSMNMNDIFNLSSIEQERGLSYPFARSYTFSINVSF